MLNILMRRSFITCSKALNSSCCTAYITSVRFRISARKMATVKDSIPHVVRTAKDERQRTMYSASIGRIEQVNSTIRLLRLYLDNEQVGRVSTAIHLLLDEMICFNATECKIGSCPRIIRS